MEEQIALFRNNINDRLYFKLRTLSTALGGYMEISKSGKITYSKIIDYWVKTQVKTGKLKEVDIQNELGNSKFCRLIFKALFRTSMPKGWL